ncbi:unnamed protein product [Linum trigynum]|uniref:Uncharacterized protein n=1 Tax=Linum trigynum TaxID=586398 RepID=A0AAV2G9S8_9ROSI
MVQQPEGVHGNGTNGELQNKEVPADGGEMVKLLIEGLETGGVIGATTAVEVENTDVTMETTQGGVGDKEPNPEG